MIGNLDALGNPSNPRYSEVNLQLAMQGENDYRNGGEGWGGLQNAFNRYNPERPAFEAFSGMHMMEGPQLGEPLTGEEKAVAWANTISLAASVGAGLPGTMRAFSAEALGAGGRAVMAGAADTAAPEINILPSSGNRFVVSPGGDAIIVPRGASGPVPIINQGGRTTGFGYTGGSGGLGLDARVSNVRIMDPTLPGGPSPGYPAGYVNYQNSALPTPQSVNPFTGQLISRTDPHWHIPLTPP